jgi:hypothetical protein
VCNYKYLRDHPRPCGVDRRVRGRAAGSYTAFTSTTPSLKYKCYRDWHRVEPALNAIAQQVENLERVGWRESPAAG